MEHGCFVIAQSVILFKNDAHWSDIVCATEMHIMCCIACSCYADCVYVWSVNKRQRVSRYYDNFMCMVVTIFFTTSDILSPECELVNLCVHMTC